MAAKDTPTEAKTDENPGDDKEHEFPAGAWPEAPFTPVAPQFPEQAGDRLRIFPNVSIFGLPARVEAEVFDHPEVHAAADQGLVEILSHPKHHRRSPAKADTSPPE